MELLLLGPVELRVGGQPVALGARQQRAVLAMLALEAGRVVSADRLADGLWGEDLPASGAKMVQQFISHLRRALAGSGAEIVTRGRGYELRLDGDGLDVARFERLVGERRPREALELTEHVDDPGVRSETLLRLGLVAHERGDHAAATARYEEVVRLCRPSDDVPLLDIALGNLADIALREGRFEASAALSTESVELEAESGVRDRAAVTLLNLGSALLGLGRAAEAEERFAESLTLARELGLAEDPGYALDGLAAAAAALGQPERAARLAGAADAVFRTVGVRIQQFEAERREEVLSRLREELGPEALAAAMAQGATRTTPGAGRT